MKNGIADSRSGSEAAKKAWATIRRRRRERALEGCQPLDVFLDYTPESVHMGEYRMASHIIKPSRLTSKDNGGIGKDPSEGWAANFAIGCTHGCPFCYVDSIHRRYRGKSLGFEDIPWGFYLFIPEDIEGKITDTPWRRWRGKEVMLSSTHDPYIPQLAKYSRRILEEALPEGVRFCIQTRSPLVLRDIDLIEEYRDQVRLQVSIASMDREFSRAIEPRVAPPESRLRIISMAKERGIDTGIIVAPVFPPLRVRKDPVADVDELLTRVEEIRPDHIYGESIHVRGTNMMLLESVLCESFRGIDLAVFDREFGESFMGLLERHGLEGQWWPEHRKKRI